MVVEELTVEEKKKSSVVLNLVLFAVSVILCVYSVFFNSALYLVVPVIGLFSIIVSVIYSSPKAFVFGLLEVLSPAFVIGATYVLYHLIFGLM